MRVVNKKLWVITITLLVVIECVFTYLSIKSYGNKDIKEIKEENKVNKEMFSMYVENKDGEYEEYTDSEYYPIGLKYYFNEERSNCTDNKGKVVNDVISYNNNKITVSSNKTLFCYLYFDLDKVPPQTFTFYLGGNTNPEYINKTSTTVYLSWTDNDITSYCINTENNSSTCSWVGTSGNSITPSYTISTQGSQTRYAFIRDAAENISPVVSDSVFLDSVSPVITSASDSGAGTANVTVTETGSGVTHVCVNTSSTSTTGCIWDEVSGTTFTSTTAVTSTGNYYIHVKDKAGNIGHRTSSLRITKPVANLYTLCSSYANMGTCMASEYGSSKLKEISNITTSETGGMYRYQGTAINVTNNYICFGTTGKSTCTGNTDKYMYRIIGVDSTGKLKLLKQTKLSTEYIAYTDLINSWVEFAGYSDINGSKFLRNTNYVPTGWSSKIAVVNWNFGDISLDSFGDPYLQDGDLAYEIESTWENSVSAKIGLIYIHDYLYSNKNGQGGIRTDNVSLTWMWIGVMTMSGIKENGYYNFYAVGPVYDIVSTVTDERYATPVFYLTSDIKITGGTGTIDNPYIIY